MPIFTIIPSSAPATRRWHIRHYRLKNKIGTMLPCNVIVQEREPGNVEVSAVDPAASMMAVENDSLAEIAKDVQKKLTKVIKSI